MPKILFLDQSGSLGGAELCLLETAKIYRDTCLVILFEKGDFQRCLEAHKVSVNILDAQLTKIRKNSSFFESLKNIKTLLKLVIQVLKVVDHYDLIYANTQKALIIGALVSLISRRPLVYHLHDILSPTHFSAINRYLAVTLANHCASLVITNSQATQVAFIEAGGRKSLSTVIYNGFESQKYQNSNVNSSQIKQKLGLESQFMIGHFSRLSPWKGQHILLEALAQCPDDISAIFVGEDLFREKHYTDYLHQQIDYLGLKNRVKFLGFQHDIIPLMHGCDLITHTSTSPEPLGRVIIEAMLCGKPVIASNAGGVKELVENAQTGWLVSPGNAQELAQIIRMIKDNPQQVKEIAKTAQSQASKKFDLERINQQTIFLIEDSLNQKKG